ncbi:MAG: DUF502 domain-containing protein [Rhodospirillales bacterium]
MTDETQDADKSSTSEPKPTVSTGFFPRMRAYFFAGILVTAPVTFTFYLAWLLIHFVDNTVRPLIPVKYNPETYLPFALPGLGLFVLIVTMTLIGALTAGFMGRFFIKLSERLLNRMPVIRSVYNATKQILETVLAQQSNAFREAVLVEYPRRGIWAIAFITGTTKGEVQSVTEEECINIFLPTTPNPTSGFLLFVPRADLVSLDMTVEEAIKMVISGGIVTPPDRRPDALKKQPVTSARIYEELEVLRENENKPVVLTAKRPAEIQEELQASLPASERGRTKKPKNGGHS